MGFVRLQAALVVVLVATASTVAVAAPAGRMHRAVAGRARHAPAAPPPSPDTGAPIDGFVPSAGHDPTRGVIGGQWFKDLHGDDWFGKPGRGDPSDADRIGNEVAIDRIYRLARTDFATEAPETRTYNRNGRIFVLSRKLSLSTAGTPFDDKQIARFAQGFVVDAWLANWDVGEKSNLSADTSGSPVRTEAAGGGLFRPQGERKGAAFRTAVTELRTMRDPSRPASFPFRQLSEHDVRAQVARFASWYPAHRSEVEGAIDGSGMGPVSAKALKAKLDARAAWLVAQSKRWAPDDAPLTRR